MLMSLLHSQLFCSFIEIGGCDAPTTPPSVHPWIGDVAERTKNCMRWKKGAWTGAVYISLENVVTFASTLTLKTVIFVPEFYIPYIIDKEFWR